MEIKSKVVLQFISETKSLPITLNDKQSDIITMNNTRATDLFILGYAIYEIERFLFSKPRKQRSSKKKPKKNKNCSIENLQKCSITLHSQFTNDEKKELEQRLKTLFLFLYKKNIEFDIIYEQISGVETSTEKSDKKIDAVLLFSGGLDSVLGLNYCSSTFKNPLAVYVHHTTAVNLKPVIDKLERENLTTAKVPLIRVNGPPISTGYFANTRGLLYLFSGAIFAHYYNCPLIISECGTTMYQIKFGPLYHITYTTHPLIISLGEKCIQIILGNTVTVQRPFSNDTKAEMVAKWRGEDKSIIANSFSCQKNLRFASKRGNCGECYACLVRRLSLLITGDPTIYEVKNISDIKELKQELWPILNFSVRMLINYDSLDYWQKKNIEKYHKKELFEKFAKDTILAIKMLSKKEKLPDWSLDLLSKASDYLLENCK